ncbi:MAG TPA: hypothetical protein VHZ78_07805 [Rhizomicrobium sp.]|jgi:hypothetical protein|nr:hypothetical protein [Rhizomicrobium sp.]
MRRFGIGLLAGICAVVGGSLLGIVLLYFWQIGGADYHNPGGVILAAAQALIGVHLCFAICDWFNEATLGREVLKIVAVVQITVFVLLIGLAIALVPSYRWQHLYRWAILWEMLSTIVFITPWIAYGFVFKDGEGKLTG